jgi:hypothetical protein
MKESIEEEEKKREFSFNGRDSSILPDDYDLFEFFERYEEDNVCIDGIEEQGKDGDYCGFVFLPCQTMEEGLIHLKEKKKKRKIKG